MGATEQIKNHCKENKKEESCGFLLRDKISRKLKVFECENIFPGDRSTHFEISWRDSIDSGTKGEVLACYHSHIFEDSEFSECDKMMSENLYLPFLMFNENTDTMRLYDRGKDVLICSEEDLESCF
jgi:proteasome lid subunit RPN8/RPN11